MNNSQAQYLEKLLYVHWVKYNEAYVPETQVALNLIAENLPFR